MQESRIAACDLACRRGDRVLFSGLCFDLGPGDAFHIAGANGIGKSSLIRILAGLLRPLAGTVDRRGAIGLIDERPALDPALPLGRALAFWQRIDGPADSELARLGLAGLLDVPVRYLSTGQRKRAAFARLLGQRAAVWLLDEPLNGLDSMACELAEALVSEHCAGGGICVTASHQPIELPTIRRLELADYTPPLQGSGGGWGLSSAADAADTPQPNPVSGKQSPGLLRSWRGHDRPETPKGEGLS